MKFKTSEQRTLGITFQKSCSRALTVAVCGGALALATLATPNAHALAMLEFDDVGVGAGTISYDGAGGALIGANIRIDQITGTSTPANSGVALSIVGGVLSFQTGANTSEGGAGGLSTFGSGGSFTLSGTVFNGLIQIATGNLITGSFTGTPYFSGGNPFSTFGSFGIDTKNIDLLAFYGILNNSFSFANTEIASTSTFGADGSFRSQVVNADINNMENPGVPDGGATIALFGLALLGVESLRRKMRI